MTNRIRRGCAAVGYAAVASRLHQRVPKARQLRARMAREIGLKVGDDVNIKPHVHLTRSVELRDGAGVGEGTKFLGAGTVILGARLKMGPQCMFITNDHPRPAAGGTFSDLPGTTRDIVIEEDVFLGARVIVLPGVTIGARSLVGAGAVVSRSVPPDTMVAGNPAKVIGQASTAASSR